MSLIPLVDYGQQPSADFVNRQRDTARNLTPRSSGGLGAMVRNYAGGTISVPLRREQPAPILGANDSAPFDLTVDGTTCTFRAGTINGLLPSNYLTGVTISATGTRYLVLNCTASNGQITGASFSADTSQPGAIAPTIGVPPSVFSLLIGLTIDGEPIKIWEGGNIAAAPAESFRVDRSVATPGALPYEIFYTWEFRVV